MALSFNTSNSLYDFVVREGNGVKGVADLGLSELPERYIKPPEERMDKQDSRTCDAPPIDLSKLNVVNHGVPLELLESLKDAAHTFFNLPPEKKAVYRAAIRPILVTKLGTSFVPEKVDLGMEGLYQ
ncbi:hypothetical protein JHK87_043599 [Glycine soja]|nr:hypothetical protein JHK87_043599 [Glycine soja]